MESWTIKSGRGLTAVQDASRLMSASGVKFAVDFAQTITGDVGVNFGGADVGMAEEFLDDAEVGTVLQKVGGEAVAQHVGSDVAFDASMFHPMFDPQPECDRCERCAALGQEKGGGRFGGDKFWPTRIEVMLNGGDGFPAQWHNALFVPLPDHVDKSGVEMKLFETDGAQLGQTQAGGVGQLENGLIAEGGWGFGFLRRQKTGDFYGRK